MRLKKTKNDQIPLQYCATTFIQDKEYVPAQVLWFNASSTTRITKMFGQIEHKKMETQMNFVRNMLYYQ